MSKQRAAQPAYMVSVFDDPDSLGALRFTFVPKPKNVEQIQGEAEPPHFILSVQGNKDQIKFNWIEAPKEDATREKLEKVAGERVTARAEWLARVGDLVSIVKGWAEELDWATRTLNKDMEDSEVGNYKAPALLLQQETVRLFLEPIARVAPGTEGSVELCLMPSYDDIAGVYYYIDRWNLHYKLEQTPGVGSLMETKAMPLTKETLRRVFDEMRAHAE